MSDRPQRDEPAVGGRYAGYVTAVLVVVYIFNFIDRQIVAILAEEIKADIGISDAQIGFLYGTAFAVFYALFGIPLGKLADTWTRKNLIAIGLGFWSLMTALSGTARSFAALATYRVGVGIGEASATPAAFSMLSDYFPPRLRATVLGIYSSGIYIGAGIGIFLGGWIVDGWNSAYPDPGLAPFGLRGWQAAYLAVGLPGLLLAVWVYTLREPRRGQSEGIVTAAHPHPFRATARELMAVLPPFTLLSLVREKASWNVLRRNLAGAALIALAAWGLIELTADPEQWIALGLGAYAAFSWVQSLGLRDPPTFAMMFRSPAFLLAAVGFASMSLVAYAFGAWAPPYFIRMYGISATEAGLVLGGILCRRRLPRDNGGRDSLGQAEIQDRERARIRRPCGNRGHRAPDACPVIDQRSGFGVRVQLRGQRVRIVLDRGGGKHRQRPGDAENARHGLGVLHSHGDRWPGPGAIHGRGDQ